MKKFSLFLIIVAFSISNVIAQRFELKNPEYVSGFSPLDLNLIQRSLENKQRQYDSNLDYLRALVNWAQDLKGKQTDDQFSKSMDYYIDYLNDMYGQDLSNVRTTLSAVENGINSEINSFNKRNEEKNNPNNYWQKGLEYFENKDYNNAITQFKIVQSLAPEFEAAYPYLGYSYYVLGDLNLALSNFNKSIEINPTKEIYEYRGWTKYYLLDYYNALLDFNQQVNLDPTNHIAYYNRGSAKNELNDNYGAINDYEKAIELEPSFSMAYNNLGWTYFEKKKYKEAIKYLNIAIEKDSSNYIAWDSRAETRFNLADYKGCIYDCTMAIFLNNQMANSYFIRGRANFRTGKKKDACIDWSEAGQYGMKEAYEYISKYCK